MKSKDIKILLVDDEPDVIEIIRYNLDKEGYTLMTASDGKEALKKVKKDVPHLVIMDVMMREGFGCKKIHSEYGMTELFSQAYSKGDGIFECPPWMRVSVRENQDPFQSLPLGHTGGLNIIDLANKDSCAFIATEDLGKVHANNKFEVLGRFDHSEIRGCNLMVV